MGGVVDNRRPGGAGAGDGESRVGRETSLDCETRLVKSAELSQGGGQPEIW